MRALRDLALVSDQLRELQAAVAPAAEQIPSALSSATAHELASLSSTLEAGTGSLSDSLSALSVAVQKTALIEAEDEDASDAAAAAVAASKSGRLAPGGPRPKRASDLKSLTGEASRLHATVEKARQLLLLLEEQESGQATRTLEMFNAIDINADGELQYDEFEESAAALLNVGALEEATVQQELRSRFDAADKDNSGSLNYDEFTALMSSLKGDAVGPLRTTLHGELQELLRVSLQMIAVTLSTELSDLRTQPVGRARELAVYVDRWCDIEAQASRLTTTAGAAATSSEGGSGGAGAASAAALGAGQGTGGAATRGPTGAVVPVQQAAEEEEEEAASATGRGTNAVSSSSASASSPSTSSFGAAGAGAAATVPPNVIECQKIEYLLAEVGSLAGALSLPNATSSGTAGLAVVRQSVAKGLINFRSAMAFCATGIRILARDVIEVFALIRTTVQGEALQAKDWALVKRVLVDCLALVPYTIIMIIPLSPPGHVFAFSLMKKCFPAAVPSPFTAQRQDVYEIYSKIAYEAKASSGSDEADTVLVESGAGAGVASTAAGAVGAVGKAGGALARSCYRLTKAAVGKTRGWLRKGVA